MSLLLFVCVCFCDSFLCSLSLLLLSDSLSCVLNSVLIVHVLLTYTYFPKLFKLRFFNTIHSPLSTFNLNQKCFVNRSCCCYLFVCLIYLYIYLFIIASLFLSLFFLSCHVVVLYAHDCSCIIYSNVINSTTVML